MRYLHTMLTRPQSRCGAGFLLQQARPRVEARRVDSEKGRFTLVFLAAPEDEGLVAESEERGRDGAAGRTDLQLGHARTMARRAISATSPMRSTTSTRPATSS